ncbi:5-(carboxyamino)imidazole ribonucleotide mutase [Geomonas propionica]|uniref:N5-carboxyaminoimidazole ribonucleotide mutase n=1 Tax=Geomonas propionica TaxID=2798582 RepID=A0ABS0YX89_9BACT|nr:5-(carboxyamino)imidazole ribonucleotide mutase [Geomonas propionica]MBJ6802463.1 5-(carboxyamino)imidazole ribonucleotide mutase [Geomonas propionica]
MSNPTVLILMGSDSDLTTMEETARVLTEFGVPYEMHVSSAHRSPAKTSKLTREAEGRGIQVIIAAAGMAAHLAGVVAAETPLPVIAVPMPGGALNGVDALYAMVQMPGGMPVATMAIGKAGAKNAGLLAVQMLSLSSPELRAKFVAYKTRMAEEVEEKDRALQAALRK